MKKRPRLQKLSNEEQSQLAQAQQLFDAGRFAPAGQLCERLIDSKPRAPEPLLLASWIGAQEGDFFTAQASVQRAAELLPTDSGVQAWAAQLCSDAGDLRAAALFEKQALKLGKPSPPVLRSLAASYTNAERFAEALPCYQRLLALEPENPGNLMNVAYAARYAGDMTLARESLLQLLELNPRDYQALYALSQLQTATANENHIEQFEASLATAGSDIQAASFLGYALGKEYEDLGEYDRSFQSYQSGARAVLLGRRGASPEAAMIDKTRRRFAELPGPEGGDLGRGMIFVLGLPRTGTTLLERILGAHSQVDNAGELRAFPFQAHRALGLRLGGAIRPELLDGLDELDLTQLGRAYLNCIPQGMQCKGHLTDKNPINFIYAGLIARALPGATIVSVRRNPMDSCFSNFKQLFAPGAYMHSYDLQELADYYTAYAALMNLWQQTLGERYIEIAYEDLVGDFAAVVSRVLRVCGLDWEEPMSQFYARKASVGSASFAQVRQPVYTSSVAKWRRYESQLEPMRQALLKNGVREQDMLG